MLPQAYSMQDRRAWLLTDSPASYRFMVCVKEEQTQYLNWLLFLVIKQEEIPSTVSLFEGGPIHT